MVGSLPGRRRGVERGAERGAVLAAVAIAVLLAAAPGLSAQEERSEAALLRDAAALEARGDLDAAAEVLEGLLERRPASSGGLFALERIYRTRGTLAAILPFADRYLGVEPDASGTRYLKLRVLVEVDSLEAVEPEIRRWIEAAPGSSEPWREGARTLQRSFGAERALVLLQEGEQALGDPAALAVEVGDMLQALGRTEEAVEAWGRSIEADGSDVSTILRRLEGLEGDRSGLVGPLVEALDGDPTTVERRRAAVRLALESGLPDVAVRVAGRVLSDLDESASQGFLIDLARRGEEVEASGVALWAYRRLREGTDDEAQRRALDVRISGAALAAGDTARALEAQRRLAGGLAQGSAERRRVLADMMRVEVGRADPADVVQRLEAFRREFPDARELDELSAEVAAGLQVRGEGEAARRVLEGVTGPRSSVERAYIVLESGDVDAARAAFGEALPGLAPARATPVIQLVGLLGRLQGPARALVAESAVLAHRGRGAEAVGKVAGGVSAIPREARPDVLAHGARLADELGLAEEAAALRTALLEEHPEAPQVGEATLALARSRAAEPGGLEEAIRLLEALILARPNAAVAPDARRELERLRRRGRGERR